MRENQPPRVHARDHLPGGPDEIKPWPSGGSIEAYDWFKNAPPDPSTNAVNFFDWSTATALDSGGSSVAVDTVGFSPKNAPTTAIAAGRAFNVAGPGFWQWMFRCHITGFPDFDPVNVALPVAYVTPLDYFPSGSGGAGYYWRGTVRGAHFSAMDSFKDAQEISGGGFYNLNQAGGAMLIPNLTLPATPTPIHLSEIVLDLVRLSDALT